MNFLFNNSGAKQMRQLTFTCLEDELKCNYWMETMHFSNKHMKEIETQVERTQIPSKAGKLENWGLLCPPPRFLHSWQAVPTFRAGRKI